PLRTLIPDGGCLFGFTDGMPKATKALTNGYIYYDPGHLLDFSPQATREFDSFWNAAFALPQTGQTLVVGFLENDGAEGHVVASFKQAAGAKTGEGFSLTARYTLAQHF